MASSKVMQEVFVATQEKYSEAAERANSNWYPGRLNEPWEGTVALTECPVSEGTDKNGVSYVTLKPKFQIQDPGDLEGQCIVDDIFLSAGPTKDGRPSMGQSKLARLASCLSGETIKDQATAYETVLANLGAVLAAKVVHTKSKSNGNVYPNLYLNRRLDQ